jgi:peptidyl-prolyl cis-trans isomerase C
VLPSGNVAMVGVLPIPEDRVLAVARAQAIGTREALDREIRDTIFASGAIARGYEQSPLVRAAVRARLSRALLAHLNGEASRVEPNADELAEATARHFIDLDRPEAFRVIHAVVRVASHADAPLRSSAHALAERLTNAVAPANDEAEFRRDIESVGSRGGLEVVVEVLKPVAPDGRVVDLEHPGQPVEHYAVPFARAASRLSVPGQKSGVVATDFGFHVLMLLDKTPPHTVPLEERRRTLWAEIVSERAKRRRAELVEQLRAASPPVVERNAATLLASEDLSIGDGELP